MKSALFTFFKGLAATAIVAIGILALGFFLGLVSRLFVLGYTLF